MPSANKHHNSKQLEAIGNLSPAIAHDINNLLSAVLGYSELLRRSVPSALRPHVEEIADAAKRIAFLTRILMVFKQKRKDPQEASDFNSLLLEMEHLIPHLLGPDIGFNLEIGPRLRPVRADLTQLIRILVLLAVEIRDGMPEGGKLNLGVQNLADPLKNFSSGALESGYWILMEATASGTLAQDFAPPLQHELHDLKHAGEETDPQESDLYETIRNCGAHWMLHAHTDRGMILRVYLPAVV